MKVDVIQGWAKAECTMHALELLGFLRLENWRTIFWRKNSIAFFVEFSREAEGLYHYKLLMFINYMSSNFRMYGAISASYHSYLQS